MSFLAWHLNNSVSFDTAGAYVTLNKWNNQSHQQHSALFVNLYYGDISSLGLWKISNLNANWFLGQSYQNVQNCTAEDEIVC